MNPNRLRLILWTMTLVAGLLVGGFVIMTAARGPAPAPGASTGAGTARIGGPFQLTDMNGRPVTEALLRGRWSVVFFGFTYCPDVCPTTMQMLAQAQDQLGPRGRDLQVVFVSVDPQRDTPRQLHDYLTGQAMPRNVVGLTGTPGQVAAAARAYGVFYQRAGDGPNYTVNHSTAAYLMDPQGRFQRVLAYGLTPEQTAQQIRDAMNRPG